MTAFSETILDFSVGVSESWPLEDEGSYSWLLFTFNRRVLFGGWGDIFDVSTQRGDLVKPRVLWPRPVWPSRQTQTCQQKADGKMKRTGKEGLSDDFKFIRSGTEMWRVLLWGLLHSNKMCPCFEMSICSCLFSAAITQHTCSNVLSHPADSSAHRRCWHLLRDPCRWQGAQSLPEGQGAAGDPAPQSHGEGENLFWSALKKPFRGMITAIGLPFAIRSICCWIQSFCSVWNR